MKYFVFTIFSYLLISGVVVGQQNSKYDSYGFVRMAYWSPYYANGYVQMIGRGYNYDTYSSIQKYLYIMGENTGYYKDISQSHQDMERIMDYAYLTNLGSLQYMPMSGRQNFVERLLGIGKQQSSYRINSNGDYELIRQNGFDNQCLFMPQAYPGQKNVLNLNSNANQRYKYFYSSERGGYVYVNLRNPEKIETRFSTDLYTSNIGTTGDGSFMPMINQNAKVDMKGYIQFNNNINGKRVVVNLPFVVKGDSYPFLQDLIEKTSKDIKKSYQMIALKFPASSYRVQTYGDNEYHSFSADGEITYMYTMPTTKVFENLKPADQCPGGTIGKYGDFSPKSNIVCGAGKYWAYNSGCMRVMNGYYSPADDARQYRCAVGSVTSKSGASCIRNNCILQKKIQYPNAYPMTTGRVQLTAQTAEQCRAAANEYMMADGSYDCGERPINTYSVVGHTIRYTLNDNMTFDQTLNSMFQCPISISIPAPVPTPVIETYTYSSGTSVETYTDSSGTY